MSASSCLSYRDLTSCDTLGTTCGVNLDAAIGSLSSPFACWRQSVHIPSVLLRMIAQFAFAAPTGDLKSESSWGKSPIR